MSIHPWLSSSRLFLYSGIGLILLTLVSLPIKIQVNEQTPEFPDYEDFNIGLLFAPIVGAWSLASVALGIIESSLPRTKSILCLLPIFALIYVGIGFASWMVISFGVNWFWRAYFGFIFIPFLIIHTAVFFYFTKKERLSQILKNPKIRMRAFIVLVAVPLLFVAVFLALFFILNSS